MNETQPERKVVVNNHGDYAEREFPCGHSLLVPIGYRLTRSFSDAKRYLLQYEVCIPCASKHTQP